MIILTLAYLFLLSCVIFSVSKDIIRHKMPLRDMFLPVVLTIAALIVAYNSF